MMRRVLCLSPASESPPKERKMEQQHLVKVVVPVYKPQLPKAERASLRQTVEVLGRYPIVVIHPEDMDTTELQRDFPEVTLLGVSTEWLGLKNGIGGYNRMMLSEDFYALFPDTEYLLICHTDAWIFRDELEMWCRKGYDCVAAPWVLRWFYKLPLIAHYLKWKQRYALARGRITRQVLYGRIGNGGLSLRRVETFLRACQTYKEEIEQFIEQHHHLFNEDVFWATVPKEFRYPSVEEALRFSFDTHPRYCYQHCHHQLPFGCHSWSKPRMYRFWRRIIPVNLSNE